MSNKTLNEIALGTNTDKATSFVLNGTRRKAHGYTLIYDELLIPLRKLAQSGKGKIRLMEFGIGEPEGKSLQMWGSYFGVENCEIHSLDYRQSAVDIINGWGEPYYAYYCDQSRKADLEKVAKDLEGVISQLDIFLDDGSHENRDIIQTFETFFPLMKDSSLYIVEDIYHIDPNGKIGAVEYFKSLVDSQYEEQYGIKYNEVMEIRFLNQVVIIKKGKNTNVYGNFHSVEN